MMQIIRELKQEHEQLISVLSLVKKLGKGSVNGKSLLFAARENLIQHLQREAETLYPTMRQAAASGNDDLKLTLDIFAKDLEGINRAIMDFFRKYASDSPTPSESNFSRDLQKLLSALEGRIRAEEVILYREYQKLQD